MQLSMPPQLTPSSLFTEQAKLDSLRLETYNRLLGGVHQKIKWASAQRNTSQMTYYDVPEWVPGCPRYDVKDCILYLVWNLRHSGFRVIYMSPNRLMINWREHSIQYYTEESPIRQAMMSVAAGLPQAAAASAAAAKAGEKKKAANYKPTAEGVAGLLTQGARRKTGDGVTITLI
jgi:hypothetical protein